MTKTKDSDEILDAFAKRAIASRNLRSLNTSDASDTSDESKDKLSEEGKADAAPFKPAKL